MLEEKIKKIINSLKSFFNSPKEIIKFILPIVLIIVLLFPMPYYIKLGGGTIEIDSKIKIENETKSKGSFNALYVSEIKGNVILYLLSYVVPSFERVEKEKVALENETSKDYDYREKMYFTSSSDIATKVAYEKAMKEVKVKNISFVVLYIDKKAKTELEVKDKILKIDDKSIKDYQDIVDIIGSKKKNDKVSILVERDKKIVKTYSKIIEIDKKPKLGVVISNLVNYDTDPKISFDFEKSQTGPSGGLVLALSIYNKLVDEDITKGKTVMGTGTIDYSGNIGAVGGIKHKLRGAYKNKADIVLVPEENCKEALKEKEANDYKFALIKIKTFDDAVEKLRNF